MRDEMIKVVEGYLEGLRKKDLSEVAFAPDVTFESPLSAKLIGEQAVADLLSRLLKKLM